MNRREAILGALTAVPGLAFVSRKAAGLPRIDVRKHGRLCLHIRPMLNGRDATDLSVVWADERAGLMGAYRQHFGKGIEMNSARTEPIIYIHRGRVRIEGTTPEAEQWLADIRAGRAEVVDG